MAVPKTLLWDREPHTKAKHDMLGVYLGAWFPIIASRYADTGATCAEGFSGPGEYTDHSEGSPLIALRAANTPEVAKHSTTLRMVLVEERADRLDHLVALIDAKHLRRAGRDITPICGTCEADLLPALDQVGAWAGPLFVNLDGWGVDTPYDIVRRVGASKSSEVMITFGPQFFTRFAALEDLSAGDIVFGEAGWRDVADVGDGPAKKQFLVDRYRARLHDAGFIFTLTFEMLDEGGHGLFLVFGTANRLGLEKMKDAM
jgi:three-Cys-motif partner protein